MRPCLAGSPGGPAVPAAAGLGPQLPREQRQQAVGLCCAGEEDTGWTGLVWSGWTGHRGRGGPAGEVLWPIPSARERAASQREPQSLPGGWRNAPSHLHLTGRPSPASPVGSESEFDSALLVCTSLPTASGLSPALLGHSACPSPQLSHLLRPPHPALPLPHLSPTNPLSPLVSCLLMSLCLFCFPLHNLPFFPPLPSPQCAGPSGRLGEGRWGGGRG